MRPHDRAAHPRRIVELQGNLTSLRCARLRRRALPPHEAREARGLRQERRGPAPGVAHRQRSRLLHARAGPPAEEARGDGGGQHPRRRGGGQGGRARARAGSDAHQAGAEAARQAVPRAGSELQPRRQRPHQPQQPQAGPEEPRGPGEPRGRRGHALHGRGLEPQPRLHEAGGGRDARPRGALPAVVARTSSSTATPPTAASTPSTSPTTRPTRTSRSSRSCARSTGRCSSAWPGP